MNRNAARLSERHCGGAGLVNLARQLERGALVAAVLRPPEVVLDGFRQRVFGGDDRHALQLRRFTHFHGDALRHALNIVDIRQQCAVPSVASGEQSASARLAAISMASVTRVAPEASTPRPIPGKM